jgi:two-component system LytT family response regulator
MLRILIADDEDLARAHLASLLGRCAGVEVMDAVADGAAAVRQALAAAPGSAPDALLVDLDMPHMSGLDVARALAGRDLAVVLVTGHADRALEAYEAAVFDYLLKPVTPRRLEACLERLRRLDRKPVASAPSSPSTTAATPPPPASPSRPDPAAAKTVVLRMGIRHRIYELDDVCAFVAAEGGVSVVTRAGAAHGDDSLDALEERLPSGQFLRVHRSALVNVHRVREMIRRGDRRFDLILADDAATEVAVGRDRIDATRQRLGIP